LVGVVGTKWEVTAGLLPEVVGTPILENRMSTMGNQKSKTTRDTPTQTQILLTSDRLLGFPAPFSPPTREVVSQGGFSILIPTQAILPLKLITLPSILVPTRGPSSEKKRDGFQQVLTQKGKNGGKERECLREYRLFFP
jgi:hypothetical protein